MNRMKKKDGKVVVVFTMEEAIKALETIPENSTIIFQEPRDLSSVEKITERKCWNVLSLCKVKNINFKLFDMKMKQEELLQDAKHLKILLANRNTSKQMMDRVEPEVEIRIKNDGTVVWGNGIGECFIRICGIKNLTLIDERKK
jgi:hypothetical protein